MVRNASSRAFLSAHMNQPSEMFIAMIGESRTNGKPVNKSAAYLTWDPNISKYVRKSMFSYDWINNEVGDFNGQKLTFDVVSMDGSLTTSRV